MPRSSPDPLHAIVEANAPALVHALNALLTRQPALRRISLLAAPVTLPCARRDYIARQCELIRSALLRIAGDDRWRSALPMPAGLAPFVTTETLLLPRLDACRLDALCDADGESLQLLEIQAGDPSGLGMADASASCMGSLGAYARAPELVEARRQQVLHQWRGSELPRIAVVNEDDSFVRSDTELMADFFRRQGHIAQRVDPRAFTSEGGELVANGQAFDLVIRDSHEELGPATGALNRALEAGLPRFNPFRDVWFDDKACFALLWSHRGQLPADEGAAVERHIPQTVVVSDENRASLRSARLEWVLKPALGFGGFGVVIGPDVDDTAWAEALGSPARMVAQRFIEVPRRRVARFTGREVTWQNQFVSFSFWLHQGHFSGAFVRAGAGRVVNVHQGGGIGPLIFAEE